MCAADGYADLQKILGHPDSTRLRRLLEYLMTEEQARLITLLPASPEELAIKMNIDIDTITGLLHDLHGKGAIVHKNFDPRQSFIPISTYFYPDNWFITSYSRSSLPEFYGLYRDFFKEREGDEGHWKAAVQEHEKIKQPSFRVLPAYRSILDSPELLPEEDVRTILRQAKTIIVIPCGCRMTRGPCHQSEPNVCMIFNRAAEEFISMDRNDLLKALSYEESLVIIDAAEEAGLVHRWQNTAIMVGGMLCNCCNCCCGQARLVNYGVSVFKIYAKSRYEARIDANNCNGCQICVDICPDRFAGAISMVGKPDTSDFKAIVDPEKCYGCGLCVLKCPTEAIQMELVRPADHIPGIGPPHK